MGVRVDVLLDVFGGVVFTVNLENEGVVVCGTLRLGVEFNCVLSFGVMDTLPDLGFETVDGFGGTGLGVGRIIFATLLPKPLGGGMKQ